MKPPWKALAIGGAILGTVILVANRRSAPVVRRVALIGDSYAVGLGWELAKLFPDFRWEGHIGTGTAAWANHNPSCGTCGEWISEYKPDLVLVSLGVNDSAPQSANYEAVAREIQKTGARVMWIEPPAHATTPNIASIKNAIHYLGVRTVPSTMTPLAADGLHPQNYAPWAAEIAETVRRG